MNCSFLCITVGETKDQIFLPVLDSLLILKTYRHQWVLLTKRLKRVHRIFTCQRWHLYLNKHFKDNNKLWRLLEISVRNKGVQKDCNNGWFYSQVKEKHFWKRHYFKIQSVHDVGKGIEFVFSKTLTYADPWFLKSCSYMFK